MSLLWTEKDHQDVIDAKTHAAGLAEDVQHRLRVFAERYSIVID
jgi:hypothetical protein